jgi:hypothetical protein
MQLQDIDGAAFQYRRLSNSIPTFRLANCRRRLLDRQGDGNAGTAVVGLYLGKEKLGVSMLFDGRQSCIVFTIIFAP